MFRTTRRCGPVYAGGSIVRYDHIVTSFFQNLTCPTRMGANFQSEPTWLKDGGLPIEGVSGSGNLTFFNHVGALIQDEQLMKTYTPDQFQRKMCYC